MTEAEATQYCANHPDRPTSLRCNRCEKPICPKCAVPTPTGYRCRECVRGQQKVFETTLWFDYLTASITAVGLSSIGSYLIPRFGFFTIFVAPIAGVIIAELVRLIVHRRRSRRLFQVIAIAAALGSLPILIIQAIPAILMLSRGGVWLLGGVLWQGIYTFTVTTTVYYRLAGIDIRN